MYAKPDSYAIKHVDGLTKELDAAFERIKEVIEIENYPYGIQLIAVDSEEEMQALMGLT